MSGMSQADMDRYLKLNIVSTSLHIKAATKLTLELETRTRTKVSFKNKRAFLKLVEKLPKGPRWECEV